MDFPTSEATIFLLAREYTRSGHDLSLGVRYTHLINTVKTCGQKPTFFDAWQKRFLPGEGPGVGGEPLYMGYIGMCSPKGYGFSAVLVINRVSI